MKIILTLIMMNGTVYNLGYEVESYSTRICDKLFDKVTYINKSSGRNSYGTFYKSKEVFAYTCTIEKTTERKNGKNKTS